LRHKLPLQQKGRNQDEMVERALNWESKLSIG